MQATRSFSSLSPWGTSLGQTEIKTGTGFTGPFGIYSDIGAGYGPPPPPPSVSPMMAGRSYRSLGQEPMILGIPEKYVLIGGVGLGAFLLGILVGR